MATDMDRDAAAAAEWIGATTGVAFTQPLAQELKDGTQLCALVNAVSPGAIRKVNTSKLAFKQMDNIANYIRAVKAMGLPEKDCFDTIDLYEERSMAKVVASIHAFGSLVNAKPGYAGPKLKTSVKFASKNVRKFSAAQQAAQRVASAGTGCTGGSAGIMERTEVKRPGITAGNAAVGAGTSDHTLTGVNSGSAKIMERTEVKRPGITAGNAAVGAGTGDLTAQTAGSAGVMQRADLYKGGITFGNKYAGSGDASLTAQTVGSAGVMERTDLYKGGITFGNKHAGEGSAELTAQTAGSAGVMERSEVLKPGITFGNASAGAGDAGLSAQTVGSAGVMERSEVLKPGITFGNQANREHINDADNGERQVTAGAGDGPAPASGMISMAILEDEVRRASLGSVEAC